MSQKKNQSDAQVDALDALGKYSDVYEIEAQLKKMGKSHLYGSSCISRKQVMRNTISARMSPSDGDSRFDTIDDPANFLQSKNFIYKPRNKHIKLYGLSKWKRNSCNFPGVHKQSHLKNRMADRLVNLTKRRVSVSGKKTVKKNAIRTSYASNLKDLIIQMFDKQNGQCHYCGDMLDLKREEDSGSSSHSQCSIDRIDSDNKGYEDGNMVLSCWTCNRGKGPMSYQEFNDYLDRASAYRAK